ncbi:MAG: cell division protein FtsZ [candidate division WOR-3 bacterium]
MIKFAESPYKGITIKVIGIGGGGSNAVSYMSRNNIKNIVTIALNTDAQHLARVNADEKIVIGKKITGGLGAGGDPQIGKMAMEESLEEIKEKIRDADLVFLTAGLGGGTGTGGIPVLANAIKEMGILTVGVVTKPFREEGKKKMEKTERALLELKDKVNTLLIIPNDKLLQSDQKILFKTALEKADEVLYRAVKGIVNIIQEPGYINVDFADVKNILTLGGRAIIGMGEGKGEKRGIEAIRSAISSPLLEEVDVKKSKGILINIRGKDIRTEEVQEIFGYLASEINQKEDIETILGVDITDEVSEGTVEITLIAAGIEDERIRKKELEPFPERTSEEEIMVPTFLRKFRKEDKKFEYPENGDTEI